jgi:sialic acid synthase SpsE
MSKYGKNFILSVGMSNLEEIEKAVNILKKNKLNKINLLHCVSSYPTSEKDAILICIETLKKFFSYPIGHSDHTNETFVPFCAVAMGAKIVEKHFMINKSMNCVDKPVSITEIQMKELVTNIRRYENILGNNFFGVRKVEKPLKIYRRFS